MALLSGKHYVQPDFNISFARKMMQIIPDTASVCVSNCFVPQMAMREELCDFSLWDGSNFDYYLLIDNHNDEKVKNFLFNSENIHIIATDGTIYLCSAD